MTVMFGSGLILLGELTDSHFRGERLNKGKKFSLTVNNGEQVTLLTCVKAQVNRIQ